MKLVFKNFTIESQNVKDLLNPSIVELLKETSTKVAKTEPKQKRVYRKRGSKPHYTELEKNIIKANFKRPSKKLARMLGGKHTARAIDSLKTRIRKGLV
jgi:hypothetical protein